jgi:hypothetical protein
MKPGETMNKIIFGTQVTKVILHSQFIMKLQFCSQVFANFYHLFNPTTTKYGIITCDIIYQVK